MELAKDAGGALLKGLVGAVFKKCSAARDKPKYFTHSISGEISSLQQLDPARQVYKDIVLSFSNAEVLSKRPFGRDKGPGGLLLFTVKVSNTDYMRFIKVLKGVKQAYSTSVHPDEMPSYKLSKHVRQYKTGHSGQYPFPTISVVCPAEDPLDVEDGKVTIVHTLKCFLQLEFVKSPVKQPYAFRLALNKERTFVSE